MRYRDPRPERYIVQHLATILEPDEVPLTAEAPTLVPAGTPSDPRSVFFHPGGGTGRKRWPIANYAPLIDALRAAFPAARPVLVVGEAEEDIAPSLRPLFAETLESPPLSGLPALLADRPYLGMDSGITHLAAASGARVLALFGPTDPAVWAQRRQNYEVFLTKDLAALDTRQVFARMSSLIRHEATY